MFKLVLLAYTYSILAVAKSKSLHVKQTGWLIADQVPSYRTICRFRISDD